jgi:hypothetical protein
MPQILTLVFATAAASECEVRSGNPLWPGSGVV